MPSIAILLHDIRSAHNVGSIFRTADAAGVEKVFLSGYTPTPIDRFGRLHKEIGKTALGGELSVKWEYRSDPLGIIEELRRAGWRIVAVEQDERSVGYRSYSIEAPTLLIFGNEVAGVPGSLLDRSDAIIEIPMRGKKESLNVSVAAGIVLFHIAQ